MVEHAGSSSEARPRIVVVLPTYNGEAHLREQLDSIAQQTRLPDGIIISDDFSSDNSVAVANHFASAAPFSVQVIRHASNGGLLSNLESALSRALMVADVIAFADQDDVWAPEKLEKVEEAFADPSTLVWFSDAEFIDEQGTPYGHRLWEALGLTATTDLNEPQHLYRFITGATVIGTATAARANLIQAALPFPRSKDVDGNFHYLHDGWLALLAFLREGVFLEPATLTSYRQHTGQYTAMSLLNAATSDHRPPPRTLSVQNITGEHQRWSSAIEHLQRPATLGFLGGQVPQPILERGAYLQHRADLVSGRGSALTWLRLCARGDYRRFANGWRTCAADLVRYGQSLTGGKGGARV